MIKSMEFQIRPVSVDGFADADGVYVNREGAWLGKISNAERRDRRVKPYADEGDYIPAPVDWRERVVKQL